MRNPNEYNDEDYTNAMASVNHGLSLLWQSGATIEQIEEIVQSGLENSVGAGISRVDIVVSDD